MIENNVQESIDKKLVNNLNGSGIIKTISGKNIPILNPQPEDIDINDIICLKNICRYGGQIEKHYSVLKHSNLCSLVYDFLFNKFCIENKTFNLFWEGFNGRGDWPNVGLAVQFHDASEAYIGDIIRPIKYIPQIYDVYKPIEEVWENSINIKFGIDVDYRVEKIVKTIDRFVLAIEHDGYVRNNKKYVIAILMEIGMVDEYKSFMKSYKTIVSNLMKSTQDQDVDFFMTDFNMYTEFGNRITRRLYK